jgi:glucokinase
MKPENMSDQSIENFADGPRLLADIGGTNARFGLETGPDKIGAIWVTECAGHPTLSAAISHYLAQSATVAAGGNQVRLAGIAIANPIDGDLVRMTNHHWSFSIEAVRVQFGWDSLTVVNDFKALASSLPYLSQHQKQKVGGGAERAGAAIGLVGAGTGLGVSGLVQMGERWIALDSEGGHSSFAPANEREIDILLFARRHYEHVSNERLVSGIGLTLIHQALADKKKVGAVNISAPEILERGLRENCGLCKESLEIFCEILGTIASNVAITLGAKGGMYIGGGIVLRMGEYFARSGFRQRFEQKGRFSSYMAEIPTYVITEEFPALIGMSAMLSLANGDSGKKRPSDAHAAATVVR